LPETEQAPDLVVVYSMKQHRLPSAGAAPALKASGISSQLGTSLGPRGESPASAGDHPEFLLTGKGLLAQGLPARIELTLVFFAQFLWPQWWGHGWHRERVAKKGFVRSTALLLAIQRMGFVGHVLHQVVTFFRRLFGSTGVCLHRALGTLIGLATRKP